jgi:hypothetical protein
MATGVDHAVVDAGVRRVGRPAVPAADRLGASDCERLRDGPLAQPVNALTSLAYVAVAGALLPRARSSAPDRRIGLVVHSSVLALIGFGSVAYHGPQPPGARAMHDLPIAALVGSAAVIPMVRGVRGTELAPGWTPRRGSWLAGLAIAAGLSYAGGRTGACTCDPASWIQLHGAWHLLSAAALGVTGEILYRGEGAQ